MDDRTWRLAVAVLSAAAAAIAIDAALTAYEVPSGFWTVLAAALGFLGARGVLRRNGNGNGK